MLTRRTTWLLAAALLVGLWSWGQRTGEGDLPPATPPAAESPTARPTSLPATGATPTAAPAPGTQRPPTAARDLGYPAFLPPQAYPVLEDIARGGPFDHRQDGGVFQNRERQLPPQPRGYYREFTVPTPGSDDRGARRIVTGGDPPVEYFYTDDHYASFRRFELAPRERR